MAYCRKCGAQLKEDDVFCFLCGQPIDRQANTEAFAVAETGKETVVSEQARPQMSKEESIALAEKLKVEYSTIERLHKEVSENETALRRPISLSGRRYSAFRFFWPFLIYAYLALNAVLILGVIFASADDTGSGYMITLFLAFGTAVGLLIFGGVRAGRKRDSLNEELYWDEQNILKKQKELENRTAELKVKLKNKKNDVAEYQKIVPSKYRTKYYMERVILLLQTDRATDFNDAIKSL
jgi:hypothetical protein